MSSCLLKKSIKLNGNDGAGLAAVIIFAGLLSGLAVSVSAKIANNAKNLHRSVRNPLSVELTDLPFFQVLNDDSMCNASNMLIGMNNFSATGVMTEPLGNKL
jgi:hypothetical protein